MVPAWAVRSLTTAGVSVAGVKWDGQQGYEFDWPQDIADYVQSRYDAQPQSGADPDTSS
jgi:hypothetical protein